jgi:hypothetical protein
MKIFKLPLTLTAAILALATAISAHATSITPDGTYIFQSTDGNTALDGSWVTFSGDNIVNWYMTDPFAVSPPPTDIPLTPSNSFVEQKGVFGPNIWYFIIDGNNFTGTNYYDQFKGDNNIPGFGGSHLYDGFGDPTGVWSLRTTSVPDSGTTFGLLALSLVGLVAGKHLVRRAVPSAK